MLLHKKILKLWKDWTSDYVVTVFSVDFDVHKASYPADCGQLAGQLAGSEALLPFAEVDYLKRLINCNRG